MGSFMGQQFLLMVRVHMHSKWPEVITMTVTSTHCNGNEKKLTTRNLIYLYVLLESLKCTALKPSNVAN